MGLGSDLMERNQLHVLMFAALPLLAAGCHNQNDKLLLGVCIPTVTGSTEHDSDAATGFSADQVVANLGTRAWAVDWSTDQLVVPAFDTLDASFSLGADPVQVLSFESTQTGVDCPYATGLRVRVDVSISSSDGTLVAGGTVIVDASAPSDDGTTFHYAYTIVGGTVPDDVASAVADVTASRCDGTTDVYVGLEGQPDALSVGLGGYCVDSTNGPAQDDVSSGTISAL